jgi:Flp pilus assembly pilin Flp
VSWIDRPVPGLARDRRGVVSVEYAVVIGTLAAAIIAAFTGLSGKILAVLSALVF